jgi:FXSXX-COOH protein
MSDDVVGKAVIDVSELSDGDLEALPNSVLGHALRRRLAVGVGQDYSAPDPIAAHESHV